MDSDTVIVFDLDGTLTESKCDIDNVMVDLLRELLKRHRVAIISGASWDQIVDQVLFDIHIYDETIVRLSVFPTNGAQGYVNQYDPDRGVPKWSQVYSDDIPKEDRKRIIAAFEASFKELNWQHPDCLYGDIIEDRGTQVTFSAIGQEAPIRVKCVYDVDGKKRMELVERLREFLPDFEVKLGGTTSIDVNKKGIDKAYGIQQISKLLRVDEDRMIFIGDSKSLIVNNNPIFKTNVKVYEVYDVEETKQLIRRILNFEL